MSLRIPVSKHVVALLVILAFLISGFVSVPSAKAHSTCTQTYIVQPGDRLYQIALRTGTTWPFLAYLNGIANPNLIYGGQVLCLGSSAYPNTGSPYVPPYIPPGSPYVSPSNALASIDVIQACAKQQVLTVRASALIYWAPTSFAATKTTLSAGAKYKVCLNHNNRSWQIFLMAALPPLFVPAGTFI
jgi:hypothetical protein